MLGKLRNLKGFTMIELLVVIAVIGILAVALLASLNPLEQIRKGRDTRTRSDASQLASALERYNASLGRFPWQASESDNVDDGAAPAVNFKRINDAAATIADCTVTGGATCLVQTLLSNLTTTGEVKPAFVTRITATTARSMYLYYNDDLSGSVTVCFMPESQTFAREAFDRCKNATSFGSDFTASYVNNGTQTSDTATGACPDGAAGYGAAVQFTTAGANELICIP